MTFRPELSAVDHLLQDIRMLFGMIRFYDLLYISFPTRPVEQKKYKKREAPKKGFSLIIKKAAL